ncbi:glycoside hydrolase family 92 protein [Lacibacter cauensis]|nr:glycoside hydrolase family 92 protein [Lacibacter cauensis]
MGIFLWHDKNVFDKDGFVKRRDANGNFLPYADLMNGGEIVFVMTNKHAK